MSSSILISDFLHRIKRPVELDPVKQYKLVTVKMNHNGVILRHEKLGAEIKSKMFEVRTGDFILSGIDARNGAFGIVPPELDGAIVTNDFWYFDIDETVVDKHLFLELTSTQWFDEICRKGSDGTTQRIRLQKNKFFNQKIVLPEPEEQEAFISGFKRLKNDNSELKTELTHQQTLLKKLRQQILQEAIEGKLTADWRAQNPDVEPASELLARIQEEKAQLIKEKKIKKQKPLPLISEEEKPFELPEGWVWCLVGDLGEVKGGKRVPRGHSLVAHATSHKYARVLNLTNKTIEGVFKYIQDDAWQQIKQYTISKNDLYVTIAGTIGRCGSVPDEYHLINLTENSSKICFYETNDLLKNYILGCLNSDFVQSQFRDKVYGMAMPKLALKRIQTTLVPLAPPPEQKAIVAKVEKLLTICDQLEIQITQNQTHAEQLMQAVLKEAFSQNSQQPESIVANA